MTISTFFPLAVILFGVGAVLMRDTGYYSQGGGDTYHQKRTRRLIGEIVLLSAALSLGIAILS